MFHRSKKQNIKLNEFLKNFPSPKLFGMIYHTLASTLAKTVCDRKFLQENTFSCFEPDKNYRFFIQVTKVKAVAF